jgi:hypothetical protein
MRPNGGVLPPNESIIAIGTLENIIPGMLLFEFVTALKQTCLLYLKEMALKMFQVRHDVYYYET